MSLLGVLQESKRNALSKKVVKWDNVNICDGTKNSATGRTDFEQAILDHLLPYIPYQGWGKSSVKKIIGFLSEKDSYGDTLLLNMVKTGQLLFLPEVIRNNIPDTLIREPGVLGCTSAHWAAVCGHLYLLPNISSKTLDIANKDGELPLHLAARHHGIHISSGAGCKKGLSDFPWKLATPDMFIQEDRNKETPLVIMSRMNTLGLIPPKLLQRVIDRGVKVVAAAAKKQQHR